MNSRLGNVFYWAGLAGAAICVFLAVDAVWVYQSGTSLLPISGRHLSLREMLFTVAISAVLALLSWRAGKAARSFLAKPTEDRNVAKMRGKVVKPPAPGDDQNSTDRRRDK